MSEPRKPQFVGGGRPIGKPEVQSGRIRDEYDPANFYIASVDKDSNSERIRTNDKNTVRVPPYLWALCAKWVEDDETPYRSLPDLVRDALMHRVEQLEKVAERGDSPAWQVMRIAREIDRRHEESERYVEIVNRVVAIAQQAWNETDVELYEATMRQAEILIGAISAPHKEELQRRIEELREKEKKVRRLGGASDKQG